MGITCMLMDEGRRFRFLVPPFFFAGSLVLSLRLLDTTCGPCDVGFRRTTSCTRRCCGCIHPSAGVPSGVGFDSGPPCWLLGIRLPHIRSGAASRELETDLAAAENQPSSDLKNGICMHSQVLTMDACQPALTTGFIVVGPYSTCRSTRSPQSPRHTCSLSHHRYRKHRVGFS